MHNTRKLVLLSLVCILAIDWLALSIWAEGKPEFTADAAFKPEALSKLAVIVTDSGQRPAFGRSDPAQTNSQRLVEDVFVQTLLDLGHTVAARSDLKSVLKEQALGQSGLTDGNAVEVGKFLTVPAVFVVNITEQSSERQQAKGKGRVASTLGLVSISARLVSVSTGAVWWQGKHKMKDTIPTESHLQLLLGRTASELAQAFPARAEQPVPRFAPLEINKLAVVMEGDARQTASRSAKSRDRQQEVEDQFGILLGKKGYTLVSRSDLDNLLKEKEFQASGLTEENVKDFGKILDVPVVLVVRITAGGGNTQTMRGGPSGGFVFAAIGARLVSVNTAEVLWCKTYIEDKQTKSKLDQSDLLDDVAKKLVDKFPKR